MADIAVRHLHLRGPPERQGLAAFRIEDAFNTEVRDDRLVLVRRVEIGRLPVTANPRALPDQLAGAWRRVLADAAHGGASSAEHANCVWFADAMEARRLLTLRLARGEPVGAWYWRLAVPDWREEPADRWIAAELARSIAAGDGVALLRLVEMLVAGDATGQLIRALAASSWADDAQDWRTDATPPAAARRSSHEPQSAPETIDAGRLAASVLSGVQIRRIARAIARIPTPLRDVLRAFSAMAAPAPAAMRAIGAALATRRWPELRFGESRLDRVIDEWVAQVTDPVRHVEALRAEPVQPEVVRLPDAAARASSLADAPPVVDEDRPIASPNPKAVSQPTATSERLADPPPTPIDEPKNFERASPAAGLFLCVIPLIELGWREWLAENGAAWEGASGPRLLDHIAAHHRVAGDDPVRLTWDLDPEPEEEWLRLWRVGLDRWLRRRTGINLHRLIWRSGWIAGFDDTLVVRFPVDAADIRLRRLALDRDPGWVDWLGRSVRYVYRDAPQPRGSW